MATIDSVKLPDNSAYDLTDNYSGYQKQTLTTTLTINGTQETTVEGALSGLNDYGDALADNLVAIEVGGAKNQSKYPFFHTTNTQNGITFTDNGDGTVTVSGTASDTASFYCHALPAYDNNPLSLKAGKYVITGCPNGGSDNTYYMWFTYNTELHDTGSGLEVNLPNDTSNISYGIVIAAGTAITTPITFKPMIRDARILDPTFAPFAKTNLQLTNDVASIFDILPNNAGAHNRYRGKALTIDADFWAHISDGTFENQFVGDTITINGRTYILAHANYWLHTGDTECTANHWVVISPNMGNANMNSDNSTAGGYLGSGLRSGTNHDTTSNTALADALATIKSDFGASHILSHRAYLDNAVTGGYPSAGAWVDSEAELMSQIMVYGNRFFDPSTNLGATIPALYSIDKSQLALYAQRPDLLTDRSYWWLRDVVSAAYFARVTGDGDASYNYASYSFGVRLAFGIKA